MKVSNERLTKLTPIFTAQAADDVSDNLKVKHYDYMVVQLGTAAGTDGSFFVRGTVDKDTDLTSAQSATNIWGYKYMYNLDSGAGIPGSTGVTPGASYFNEFKVNIDGAYYLALEISGMTAGAYTANIYGVNVHGS